jgi:gliding motility-associated-like protein
VVVRYNVAGTYTVSLVVDNNGCLSPVTNRVFEVRPQPRLTIGMKPEACQGEPVTVIATGATQGIDSFMWDFGGGLASSGSFNGGPYSIIWDTPGEKVVTVVVRTRECGSRTERDTIRIDATPIADIRPLSNGTVCSGDTVRLEAHYDPSYTYNWTPSAFFADRKNNSIADAFITRTGYVALEVVTGIGCRAADSVLITTKSCCDALLPTAFSPNGDGQNDKFRIISTGFHTLSAFRVADRWGRTVWETGNQSDGWDGTRSGMPADMGTYFYYLKYVCSDGKIYEKTGEVTLVR